MLKQNGPPAPDYTGRRFGRLTVLFQATEWRPHGKTLWACQCECGGQTITRQEYLRQGHTRSCGCLQRENRSRFYATIAYRASDEWNALLDTLCTEVIGRSPRPPREIHRALEDTWGPCQRRRFWRALRTLTDQGRIARSGQAQSSDEDLGSMYSLPRRQRRAA